MGAWEFLVCLNFNWMVLVDSQLYWKCNQEFWSSQNAGLCTPEGSKDLLTVLKVPDPQGGSKWHFDVEGFKRCAKRHIGFWGVMSGPDGSLRIIMKHQEIFTSSPPIINLNHLDPSTPPDSPPFLKNSQGHLWSQKLSEK